MGSFGDSLKAILAISALFGHLSGSPFTIVSYILLGLCSILEECDNGEQK